MEFEYGCPAYGNVRARVQKAIDNLFNPSGPITKAGLLEPANDPNRSIVPFFVDERYRIS